MSNKDGVTSNSLSEILRLGISDTTMPEVVEVTDADGNVEPMVRVGDLGQFLLGVSTNMVEHTSHSGPSAADAVLSTADLVAKSNQSGQLHGAIATLLELAMVFHPTPPSLSVLLDLGVDSQQTE